MSGIVKEVEKKVHIGGRFIHRTHRIVGESGGIGHFWESTTCTQNFG